MGTIFKQTLWQIIGKLITSSSTIIILGIISRNFGEANLGVFTLSLTYLAFFTLAIDFGVNAHLMTQFISKDFELVWRKLFGFRLILAAVLIPTALLGGLFWPTNEILLKQLILIGSFMAILEPAVYVSANAIFQSRLRYDLSVIGWSASALSTLIFVFLTTYLKFGLPYLMIDYSLGWFIGSVILFIFVNKYIRIVSPIFDPNFIKKLIREAWPVSATLILNVVYFRLDAFILSFYHSFSDVGIYNLAYQIFQAVLVLPTFIMNGYFPLMLKNLQENNRKFISNFKFAFMIMILIGFFVALLAISFSPLIVSVIAGGKGFIGSANALRILSLGFPAFFVSSLFMWALISFKKYKTMLLIYILGLLLNSWLNFLFIPAFSYTAASYITVISEYFIVLLQIVVLCFKL